MEEDEDDFQNTDNGKKKCKGCKDSFSMLLLLLHLKKNIACQKAYGKDGYKRMFEHASRNRMDQKKDSKNEDQTKSKIVSSFQYLAI